MLYRITYKLVAGDWVLTEFKDLKVGDSFKMFEPHDMSPVIWRGHDVFIADSTPYNNEGVWGIRITDIDEEN